MNPFRNSGPKAYLKIAVLKISDMFYESFTKFQKTVNFFIPL